MPAEIIDFAESRRRGYRYFKETPMEKILYRPGYTLVAYAGHETDTGGEALHALWASEKDGQLFFNVAFWKIGYSVVKPFFEVSREKALGMFVSSKTGNLYQGAVIVRPDLLKESKSVDVQTTEERLQRADYILLGWRQPYDSLIEALYIPTSGPRYTCIFLYRLGWKDGQHMGRAIKKAINWDDPDYYCTDALHLLPPNPDRRAEYLARKEKAMRVAR